MRKYLLFIVLSLVLASCNKNHPTNQESDSSEEEADATDHTGTSTVGAIDPNDVVDTSPVAGDGDEYHQWQLDYLVDEFGEKRKDHPILYMKFYVDEGPGAGKDVIVSYTEDEAPRISVTCQGDDWGGSLSSLLVKKDGKVYRYSFDRFRGDTGDIMDEKKVSSLELVFSTMNFQLGVVCYDAWDDVKHTNIINVGSDMQSLIEAIQTKMKQ